MNLKSIIKYNFWILLVSLIVSLPFGFNNAGVYYWVFMLPLIFLISLILNILFVIKNKEISLKYKWILSILMPIIVIALNVGVNYLIALIARLVFGYNWYMGTQL